MKKLALLFPLGAVMAAAVWAFAAGDACGASGGVDLSGNQIQIPCIAGGSVCGCVGSERGGGSFGSLYGITPRMSAACAAFSDMD